MNLFKDRLIWGMRKKSKADGVDVTEADLMRATGATAASANYWVTGKNAAGAANCRKLAEYLGIDAIWLETGESAQPTKAAKLNEITTSGDVQIPQYIGMGGAMGTGIILRDQPGEIHSWNVTPEWIDKNVKNHTGISNLCIVTGFGDSMMPLYNPGDPLIIDTGIKKVDHDGIYFFRVADEGFIKILQRIPGVGLTAISKNPDYRDWVIKPDMDFELFGKVVKFWCGSDR